MPKILPNQRLLRISLARKQRLADWKEGVSIESDSGRTVTQLTCLVAADRWRLASEHRRQATNLLKVSPPLYRCAVSRYYYAMYHALRACVYVFHEGDDHQEHRQLPQNIPVDFAPGEDWQTKLKDARVVRNRADYDPYPKSDKAFKSEAMGLKQDVDRLLVLARNYLRSKGCAL
jgi:uncharacterized protein (UPF0332 family)